MTVFGDYFTAIEGNGSVYKDIGFVPLARILTSRDPDWRKAQIQALWNRSGRWPKSDSSLYFNLTGYCNPKSDNYDADFDRWARVRGYPRSSGKLAAQRIGLIKAWFSKNGALPTFATERKLYEFLV